MDIDYKKVEEVAGGMTQLELHNEALFALSADYYYEDIHIPQPTAGSFVLLEILKNPYVVGGEITDYDIDVALFILVNKNKALGVVLEVVQFEKKMDEYLEEFKKQFETYDRNILKVFINNYFKYASNGFDMLPKNEDENPYELKKMIFDFDWLIGYVSVCHKITGYYMEEIIWNMPLIRGGFCLAQHGKENGQKNIERYEDIHAMTEELKRQMEKNNG